MNHIICLHIHTNDCQFLRSGKRGSTLLYDVLFLYMHSAGATAVLVVGILLIIIIIAVIIVAVACILKHKVRKSTIMY